MTEKAHRFRLDLDVRAPGVAEARDKMTSLQLALLESDATPTGIEPVGVRRIAPGRDSRRPLVQLESPLAGRCENARQLNVLYGRHALRDALLRGEAPFASHLLYAQQYVLDDQEPDERRTGMEAGFAFFHVVDYVVAYVDRGVSEGMREGMELARGHGLEVVERSLPDWARS